MNYAGKNSGPARRNRSDLYPILALGLLVLGYMTPAAARYTEEFFEQHQVVTGSAEKQTVLTGFLVGDDVADLAVISTGENDDRLLRIYGFDDGAWSPILETPLSAEVLFVDVANIGGRDRLITYERSGLNWFDPGSATEHPLLAVTSDFSPPHSDEIPHVDITRDVNGDGRDDLVVPDSNGFSVFIQMSNGAFADPVQLGTPTETDWTFLTDGYRYDPWARGRIHEIDYNLDDRNDLAFWKDDHFEVHIQDEEGLLAPVATRFMTEVAFDSDNPASLVAPQEVRHRRLDSGLAGSFPGKVLHSLTDMNADGVADMVIFSLAGKGSNIVGQTSGMWHMYSTYEVHFGRATPEGTRFEPDVGTAIRSDGIPLDIGEHDFGHNGQVDVTFTSIDPGILKIAGIVVNALLNHSVSLDLKVYGMDDGNYPDKPNTSRKIRAHAPGDSGEKAIRFPSVLITDVNGDGHSDLMVGRHRQDLRVFPGMAGPKLFARRALKVAVTLPDDADYTWLVDINKDGKQDILMHYPSTTEPHRLSLLIAR